MEEVRVIMDTYNGSLWIMGLLLVLFLIGMLRSHVELIINFMLRGVLGLFFIYFANYFFSARMPGVEVGYNLLTFLTSGLLGIPGVFVMYGIRAYMLW